MIEAVNITVLCALFLLAGTHLGGWLERRRSPRQSVGRSSAGQPVAAAAGALASPGPALAPAVEEELEWLRKEKNRIVTKLTEDFPSLGGGQRESIAEEIMAKARTTLARVR